MSELPSTIGRAIEHLQKMRTIDLRDCAVRKLAEKLGVEPREMGRMRREELSRRWA